jgi:hypothetical protein
MRAVAMQEAQVIDIEVWTAQTVCLAARIFGTTSFNQGQYCVTQLGDTLQRNVYIGCFVDQRAADRYLFLYFDWKNHKFKQQVFGA